MAVGPDTGANGRIILHASCVAFAKKGCLITGASGGGKSTLALSLMALGCVLVADDRTEITRVNDTLHATPPLALRGRIEARGVGILAATYVENIPLALHVDLDAQESERFPHLRTVEFLGIPLISLRKPDDRLCAVAILQMLKEGRLDPS